MIMPDGEPIYCILCQTCLAARSSEEWCKNTYPQGCPACSRNPVSKIQLDATAKKHGSFFTVDALFSVPATHLG